MSAENSRKRCFVIMGFGKKTDFETGRTLDLDRSYRNMIKPAVETAGLECTRADEIVHSGLIDVPMFEHLLNADVVIADLSTSNKNALYELGIRHALRPAATIIICEDGTRALPMDVNHVLVRQYHHLGEDISYDEVMRFRQLLTQAVKDALANLEKEDRSEPDSPVYAFLEGLQPPSIGGVAANTSGKAHSPGRDSAEGSAVAPSEKPDPATDTLAMFREQAEQAIKENRFTEAIASLDRALQLNPSDPSLIQQHVLATYKSAQPDLVTALFNARNLLSPLSPEESTDRETLELVGDIELALYEQQQGVNHLVTARRSYERLYRIKGDWRSGLILTNLLVLHNQYKKNPIDKLADIVLADQLRREVVQFGKERLAVINSLREMEAFLPKALKTEDRGQEQSRVWCAIAEACYGLGDTEGYLEAHDQAARSKSGGELLEALDKKIARMTPLLKSQAELRSEAEEMFASRLPYDFQVVSARRTPPESRGNSDARAAEIERTAPVEEDTVLRRKVRPSATGPTTSKQVGEEVFISYAWGDESEAIANKLDQAFQLRGVIIVRDKRDLGFKGRIKEFMETIGRGKCVIVIISEKYLKSENCLFELLQVAKQGDFAERVFPVVLDDARIYKPLDRIRYVQFWEEQTKQLDEAIRSVSSVNLQGFREDIDLYSEIRNHLPRLADILKDMNALTSQIQGDSGFSELFDAVMAKLAE